MNVIEFIIGRRPVIPDTIDTAPDNVTWHAIRPKRGEPVRAWCAESNSTIETSRGTLEARGGEDYIVEYPPGDHAVVRGNIFESTYERVGDGEYAKRTDLTLRYFTLDRPVFVETLEGKQRAEPGDWIVQGMAGELWPVPIAKTASKYEPA